MATMLHRPVKETQLADSDKEMLQTLSRKSGISVATLQQVKKAQDSQALRRQEDQQIRDEQTSRKVIEQNLALADQIRQILVFRNATTIRMGELVQQMQQTSVSEFVSDCK